MSVCLWIQEAAKLQHIKYTGCTETEQKCCPSCASKQEFTSLCVSLLIFLAADMSANRLAFKSTPMNCKDVKRGEGSGVFTPVEAGVRVFYIPATNSPVLIRGWPTDAHLKWTWQHLISHQSPSINSSSWTPPHTQTAGVHHSKHSANNNKLFPLLFTATCHAVITKYN